MIRLPGLLRRRGRDETEESEGEGEPGESVLDALEGKKRPWKMLNICAACHFLFSVCSG